MIKTENLTIIFVDIAGFTATTSRQSRVQNARLLQTFGSTLLPLIKSYKGKLIKTIGDALLITFRSPTDAMLCSMSLQDAMHAHNLSASEEEKIHIRVAANLGEVRVTKNDIFGEPVNVASRIEGVAPADEIYLSEAVYMAMNKAEVPVREVGFKDLAGVSQAVRLYNIPRFSTPRLVAENTSADEQGSELLYPYGGMHYHARSSGFANLFHFSGNRKFTRFTIPMAAVSVVAIAVVIGYLLINRTASEESVPSQTVKGETREAATENTHVQQQVTSRGSLDIKAGGDEANKAGTGANISGTAIVGQAQKPAVPIDERSKGATAGRLSPVTPDTAKSAGSAATETTLSRTEPGAVKHGIAGNNATRQPPANNTVNTPLESEMVETGSSEPEPAVNKQESGGSISAKAADTSEPIDWDVTRAKEAYRALKISKVEYSEIVHKLKADYERKILRLKMDLGAGKITREEYEQEVRKAKLEYSGR